MTNKETAIAFLKMAGSGNVRSAYESFVASDSIHHNQYFKGDRQSLMLAMEEASKSHPNKAIDIEHIYQDGDVVITHSRVTREDPGAALIAVVHIFRFQDDRIVELWDVGREIAKNSPNENGPF